MVRADPYTLSVRDGHSRRIPYWSIQVLGDSLDTWSDLAPHVRSDLRPTRTTSTFFPFSSPHPSPLEFHPSLDPKVGVGRRGAVRSASGRDRDPTGPSVDLNSVITGSSSIVGFPNLRVSLFLPLQRPFLGTGGPPSLIYPEIIQRRSSLKYLLTFVQRSVRLTRRDHRTARRWRRSSVPPCSAPPPRWRYGGVTPGHPETGTTPKTRGKRDKVFTTTKLGESLPPPVHSSGLSKSRPLPLVGQGRCVRAPKKAVSLCVSVNFDPC